MSKIFKFSNPFKKNMNNDKLSKNSSINNKNYMIDGTDIEWSDN